MKVLSKFGQDSLLYNYYIIQNSQKKFTILDDNFPTINPNDVLMIMAHLKDKQDSETSIGAYIVALKFLKDYIAKFGRSDVEFAPLFKTENLLALVDTKMEKIDLLNKCLFPEPELGYIYKRKNSEKKKLFRDRQKHLVHTSVFQKIFPKTAKSHAFEQIKEWLIKQLSWWTEVRHWLQIAYLFVFGDQV